MALGGAEAGEIEAKTSVLRAALRLGLAAEHPPELCEACEVVPLQAQAAQLGAHGPRKRPRPLVSRLWPPRAVWQSAAAPLQAAPFCSLEAARRLFELSATSRAQQLWTLDCTGFERIFADAKVPWRPPPPGFTRPAPPRPTPSPTPALLRPRDAGWRR